MRFVWRKVGQRPVRAALSSPSPYADVRTMEVMAPRHSTLLEVTESKLGTGKVHPFYHPWILFVSTYRLRRILSKWGRP